MSFIVFFGAVLSEPELSLLFAQDDAIQVVGRDNKIGVLRYQSEAERDLAFSFIPWPDDFVACKRFGVRRSVVRSITRRGSEAHQDVCIDITINQEYEFEVRYQSEKERDDDMETVCRAFQGS